MESGRQYTFKYGYILENNGILACYFYPIEVVDLEIAKHGSDERIKICKGKTYPCIFDISNVNAITKDARDYLANEGNELVSASAILINSPVKKMVANFFISVSRPRNLTRVFTDRESAIKWLHQVAR